jgi:predicted RNA-binding Zn-ribbon protein involved in translation (DUF1610 family)
MERNEMRKTLRKTITAFVAVTGMAGLALAGCSGSSQSDTPAQSTNQTTQKSEQAVRYTCPMHPEVLQDKPGDCPKCGMKLVEKH